MMTPRVVVLHYFGGELSKEAMAQIQKILRYDDFANAQHLRICVLSENEVASACAEKSIEQLIDANYGEKSNERGVLRININRETTPLNEAIRFLTSKECLCPVTKKLEILKSRVISRKREL